MTLRRFATLALICVFASSLSAADFKTDLEQMAAKHQGKVALFAKNLKTGETIAINADEPVQTASVIKLPVLIEAFYQAKAGKLDLAKRLNVTKEEQVPGSGILAYVQPDVTLSLLDTITLMMIVSDNTATNMTLDQVGIPNVNARIAAMGLKNTYLYKKVFRPAEGPMPPDQPKFGLGKTTAREMAEALESIHRCDLEDQVLCDRMIKIMRGQQEHSMVPRYIESEPGVPHPEWIADKLGALDDVRNDVALVMYKSTPIIISAFTWENKDQRWSHDNAAEILIASMARRIAEQWAPAAAPAPAK
jgi:beta-lactamase class A